jgi:hypothetical protein
MTLTHAPTSTLSTSLEAFAVRLEDHDEDAWKTLLSQVTPAFGDPIAAQVAHLMKTFAADGEYDGQLIRKMLSEKADIAATATAELEGFAGLSPEDDAMEHSDDDSDWPSESEEDEHEWTARRTRYLESLGKNVLIDMINMSEYEREYLIEDNM